MTHPICSDTTMNMYDDIFSSFNEDNNNQKNDSISENKCIKCNLICDFKKRRWL